MKLTAEQKAALQASIPTLEQEIVVLKAQHANAPNDAAVAEQLRDKEAALDQAKTRLQAHDVAEKNEALEAALLAQRKSDAQAAVRAAVARGAIAAKDADTQATWEKKLTEDPSNLVLLQAMRGSPALEQPRIILGAGGIQITREDSVTVLRAYNAERDPRKKGLIYARDISKRIKDGEDLPLFATNTLGTVAGEIITQYALELLTLEFPELRAVWTDMTSDQVKYNSEINTRIISIPGTTVYSTSTGYATENTTTTDVPVTISNHYSSQVSFNANELAGTSRRLLDEQAPAMMYAIGKLYVDAVYAVLTAANFTNTATTEALIDFDRSTVIDIAAALTARGVPRAGRSLLLNGDYFAKLFSDTALVTLAGMQQSQIITEGRLPRVHGFNVYECVNLPTTNNLAGFGCSKSAVVLATRVPVDYASALPGVTGGGVLQTITEPNSGLSVALCQFVDHQLGAAYARVATMYGAAKGQINAGQRLASS